MSVRQEIKDVRLLTSDAPSADLGIPTATDATSRKSGDADTEAGEAEHPNLRITPPKFFLDKSYPAMV